MQIIPMKLSYDPSIDLISAKQFHAHKTLYEGYVKKINEINHDLAAAAGRSQANATYSQFRGLKKGETYALDAIILHELYFQNLGGHHKLPGSQTAALINRTFGSFDNWKSDFIATSAAARGWCLLIYEPRSHTLMHNLLDLHDEGVISQGYPLIVIDLYEHAYFIDYATDKAAYINKFLTNINWDVVEQRFIELIQKL